MILSRVHNREERHDLADSILQFHPSKACDCLGDALHPQLPYKGQQQPSIGTTICRRVVCSRSILAFQCANSMLNSVLYERIVSFLMTVASVRYTPFWIPLDFCELVDVLNFDYSPIILHPLTKLIITSTYSTKAPHSPVLRSAGTFTSSDSARPSAPSPIPASRAYGTRPSLGLPLWDNYPWSA